MFKQKAISLLSLTLLLGAQVMAADLDQSEDDVTRSCSKRCKTFNSLKVCSNLDVGGSATVGGNLTVQGLAIAQAFLTPNSGTLFRNLALLSNTSAVTDGNNFPWAATPLSNYTSGITFSGTGLITLPTSGTFFVMYSARLQFNTGGAGSGAGINPASISVNLQQGDGTTQMGITVPTINRIGWSSNGSIAPADFTETEITGYALIRTTSSNDNVINLIATLGTNISIPAAAGTNNANGQMVIIQIN